MKGDTAYSFTFFLVLKHMNLDFSSFLQEEWLPVGIRSWSSVKVVYSLAHYSWTMKGFSFQAQ